MKPTYPHNVISQYSPGGILVWQLVARCAYCVENWFNDGEGASELELAKQQLFSVIETHVDRAHILEVKPR